MKFEDTLYAFLKELQRFDYGLSSIDHVWNLIFPDGQDKWHHVHVNKYRQVFYISHIDGNSCGLEATPKKSVQVMDSFGFSSYDDGRHDPASVWEPLIASARKWMKTVAKDWIKANKRLQASYPLNRRFGIVPNSLVRASLADIYRIDQELGKARSRKFVRLVEEGYFNKDENTVVESMAAKDFFKYCRVAYIAAKRGDDHVDEGLSGREMYKRYADGRHEGLLDINANSKQEFSDWIDGTHPKKSSGGHPWEIKRGGNTTHIDLSVYRPSYYRKEGFKIELRGASIGRLKETIQMFLAIHDASLPISIDDPEAVRKRLLAQDNIGLVPCYGSLHRANQHFGKDQHVYDVLYYDDLGRYKRRITPFVTWEPLPVLKPRDL
ncbi:MAG: hypothetical protein GY866_20855 [Proteobacteria bacterium]|nr:hypothetical protein [Pseudomonadota bacterium]